MTFAVLPLAAEPTFLWWVAPLVTFAAVCVALATSIAALRRQDRALEDNRQLRIADDVRDVLAEALRDLHLICRALEKAKSIPPANKRRARLYAALGAAANDAPTDSLNRMIDSIEDDVREHRQAADDAFAGVQLQGEHLGLLLGRGYPLYLEHMAGILLNLESLRDLEVWNLPVDDEGEQAAANAERQRQKFYERVVEMIDDLSGAGHAYVKAHQAPSGGRAAREAANV